MSSRAASVEKWWILCLLSTLFVVSFHCVLCISAVQYEITETLALSDGEFALLTSVALGAAALTCLLVPFVVGKIGLYNTLILASCILFIGQLFFLSAIYFFVEYSFSRTVSLCVQYFARSLIGSVYGIDSIAIYCVANVWFKDSAWLELALMVIACAFDLGMLSSRYCLTPIYDATSSLSATFCLGLALALVRIVACVLMKRCEERFVADSHLQLEPSTQRDAEAMSATSMALHDSLDYDVSQVRQFDGMLWCVIGTVAIGWAVADTFLTQFTLPLMIVFHVTEEYANVLLSFGAVSALTLGLLWGWLISITGRLSYWLIASMVLLFLSVFVIQLYDLLQQQFDINLYISNLNYVVVWFCILCFQTGAQYFFCVAMSCLLQVAGLRLSVLATSVAAVLLLAAGMAISFLFGVLVVDDGETKHYQLSLTMMSAILAVGCAAAIAIHIMDVQRNGPLHKSAKQKQLETTGGEGEGSPLLP